MFVHTILHFLTVVFVNIKMCRSLYCKCIERERIFHGHQVREVGDGLLGLSFAVRLSKRIDYKDSVCHKYRFRFVQWQQKMVGDFDKYDNYNRIDIETVNNNDDLV